MHAVTSKWQIELVKPGTSLLLRKDSSKDPAAQKKRFPAYIWALQALTPSHKGGSSPPKDRPACSSVPARVRAQGYTRVHGIPVLWTLHFGQSEFMQAGLLIEWNYPQCIGDEFPKPQGVPGQDIGLLSSSYCSKWHFHPLWQVIRHSSQHPSNGFLTSTEYVVHLGLKLGFLCYLLIARLIRKKSLLRFKVDILPVVLLD